MKVGVVGCGGVAPGHIRVYQKLGNEVVGLCDLNVERAERLASEFHIKNTYNDYFDLFEANELDLIDICTPVSTHRQIVCDAAKYAQAILVEKPMAMTVAECDDIIKEIKKSGSKLCIGHNQIFSPLIQKAKSIVDSGKFDLLNLRTTQKESFELLNMYGLAAGWNVSPDQRGIIWEVCCHLAYLQLHFLPEIKEVYAVGSKVKYPVYDNFTVILSTREKKFGIIELSWLSNETEIVYEWADSSGKRMQIYRDFDYFLKNSADPPFTVGNIAKDIFIDQKRLLQKWFRFGACYLHKRKFAGTSNLLGKYVEAIRNDTAPPVTPEDGRNTVNLLECIERSLDEKQPIAVNH